MKTKLISLALWLVFISPIASADSKLTDLCFKRSDAIILAIYKINSGSHKEEVFKASTGTFKIKESLETILLFKRNYTDQMYALNLDTQLCLSGAYF